MHPIERTYWVDTAYDRLDRMKLVELLRAAGHDYEQDDLAQTTRSELIDLLVSVQVEAEYDAEEAGDHYPLRRPLRSVAPDWLVGAETGRVHLRWQCWRKSAWSLFEGEGWVLPESARSGDVVLTVLGSDTALVVAVEKVMQEAGELVVDRQVLAQPVAWSRIWSGAGGTYESPGRSTVLSARVGRDVVSQIREELDAPAPVFVDAGDCTWNGQSDSAVEVLRILQDPGGRAGGLPTCGACEEAPAREVHFERPIFPSIQLEIQDHVDDAALVCEGCHRLLHPHSVAALRRALRPRCPSCGSRSDRKAILWGLPTDPDVLDDPSVVWEGCEVEGSPPRWQCSVCGHRFGARQVG